MQQSELFHEHITDALRHLVQALGGTKKVGARMRPEMAADHASRWLNDCLNEDRREHLGQDHLMLLLAMGREAGIHSALAWICQDLGYSLPQPIEPEDERADLQRQYIEAARGMQRLAERIERLNVQPVRSA